MARKPSGRSRCRFGRRSLTTLLLLAGAVAIPAQAVVVQQGNLRIMASAQLKPYKLPRQTKAPIEVFVAGHVYTTDQSTPPQLRRMEIDLNRRGTIDTGALPRCSFDRLRVTTYDQSLARCGPALVGAGHFWASVVLPDQGSYNTTGRLLAFNGVRGGKPYLFAHVYTSTPFPSSFVVPFAIRHSDRGPYGIKLAASLPQALGNWGYVNRIKMTLGGTRGTRSSGSGYLLAGCPAPKGTKLAIFPLALAKFHFAGGRQMSVSIDRPCGVRE